MTTVEQDMKLQLNMKKRNPIAKAVRTPAFKMQVVKSKKLYSRKEKFKKHLSEA